MIYGKIHHFQREINAVYSDRILMGILFNFFEIIYFTFTMITIIEYWNGSADHKFFRDLVFIFIYILSLFNRMWLIVKAHSRLNKQRKCISKIVHKLIDESAERKVTSEVNTYCNGIN